MLVNGKIQLWLQEKGVAGLGSSQSQSSPKKHGRSTPTAKLTPNIRYLALGFMFFIDHVAAKAKPEPINARNATRSRLATSFRSFSTSAATLPLPLSVSPFSECAQVQRHCSSSWRRICVVNFHTALFTRTRASSTQTRPVSLVCSFIQL